MWLAVIEAGSKRFSFASVTSYLPSLSRRMSTSGSPQTLKIWLDRMFFNKSPIMRSGVA